MELSNETKSEMEIYLDKWIDGPPPPFSEKTFFVLEITFRIFITGPVALSGLFSNVINIITFRRQGFMSHSSVVNLTALAITDFLACFFCVMSAVAGIIDHFFDTSNWSWNVHMSFVHLGGRPYNAVTQITCWITAFLAFERAISVIFPFKAKSLFTPKRSMGIMIFIFAFMALVNIPHLMLSYLVWETEPTTNRTILRWKQFDFITHQIETIFFYTSPVTLRFLSIVIVVVSNVIIFWKVYLSQKFRKATVSKKPTQGVQNKTREQQMGSMPMPSTTNTNTNSREFYETNDAKPVKKDQSNSASASVSTSVTKMTKEMRLVRMITLISAVFMVCYIPSIFHVVLYYIVWDWNVQYHWWVDVIVWNGATCLQIINASANIFIYYHMSTRYREELQLCMGKKQHT